MARADACLPIGLEAAGDKLSAKEVDEIIRQLRKRQRELRASETVVNDQDAALQAADEIAKDAELSAILVKRAEAQNLAARANLYKYASTQWRDRLDHGLEVRLAGVARARPDGRRGVWQAQRSLSQHYLGKLQTTLAKNGVRDIFASGALDKEAADALEAMSQPEVLRGMNPDAVKIAKAVHEWQERARTDANKAGAWIGQMDGYITRQAHDARRIEKAGFDKWAEKFRNAIDFSRTFADVSPEKLDDVLRKEFSKLSTGIHLSAETGTSFTGAGPASLAKKLSHERVYHFKPGMWFEYNKEFGSGNLRESVVFGLQKLANTTALMNTLGPNPEANLTAVIEQLQRDFPDQKVQLDKAKKWLVGALLPHLDGRANIPHDHYWARFWANTRATATMAFLGRAIFTNLGGDLPTYAAEMKYHGRGLLDGLAESIGSLKGRGDAESQDILASLGVFFESMSGEFISRFSADDTLSGGMSRAMRTFFKYNLQSLETDSLRAGAGLSISHHLSLKVGKALNDLPEETRRLLSLYGIDEGRWDLLRASELREHDGRTFLTPEGLSTVPDERFVAYLKERGQPSTGRAAERLREELAGQLRQYVADRVDYAVVSPDAKTRAYMLRGTRPGSLEGELLRTIGQFKSFPVAVIQRSIGRDIYGRGADSFRQATRNGSGEMVAFAQTLLLTTLFGYGAMAAKDATKGRTPRIPDEPGEAAKLFAAAMLQGGALGIYGDFLLGESNRFGRGLLETVAGPVPGMAADLDELRAAAMYGDDVAAKAVRTAVNNTPFINIFYSRLVLDYLFLYRLQEHLNPGSLRRMERKIEKENNQTFIVPPSEVVN